MSGESSTETNAIEPSSESSLLPTDRFARLRLGALVLSVVALALFPLGVTIGPFTPLAAIKLAGALYLATFAMSWDMVSGYTGEISFGHSLFFGVGGYTAGMLNLHAGISLPLAIPAGAVAAAFAGFLIGFPSLRLRGPYFSLITLVVPIILSSLFLIFPNWTGGANGLVSAKSPNSSLASLPFDPILNYVIAFAVFLLALVVFLVVARSNTGEILTAIREDEDAVTASGLNPAKYKLFAFLLSGLVGGFAGAVYVFSMNGSATPGAVLNLTLSIEVIIAAVLGGIGSITGAALGGIIFYLLLDVLSQVPYQIPLLNTTVSDVYFLIFGIVTLFFLFFIPDGLLRRGWGVVGRRFGREYEVAADGGLSPTQRVIRKFKRGIDVLLGGDDR
ncbi:MAG: branched-chain amino acid ABC transporter permease [Halorientalis sp.]